MKIAVFHNLPSGGALRTLYDKVKGLEAAGHEVSLYTFSTADLSFLSRPKISGEYLSVSVIEKGPFFFAEYWKAAHRCAQAIEASSADFVYVDKCRFFSCPPLVSLLKKKTIYYAHEPHGIREYALQSGVLSKTDSLWKSFGRLSWKEQWGKVIRFPVREYLKREDRENIHRASLVMTSSEFVRSWVERVYGIQSVVNAQGVDTDFFVPSESVERKNQVLSVGRIEPRKGFDFILEVLQKIDPKIRPKWVIICDEIQNHLRDQLESNAKLKGVELQILYRPSQEILRHYYRESRMLLCAAHAEPFGLTPLEAMACGTPVIAVREGGYVETVVPDETGLLLARSADLWAESILQALAMPEKLFAWGREARRHVEKKWTWEKFIRKLVGEASQLIASSNVR